MREATIAAAAAAAVIQAAVNVAVLTANPNIPSFRNSRDLRVTIATLKRRDKNFLKTGGNKCRRYTLINIFETKLSPEVITTLKFA